MRKFSPALVSALLISQSLPLLAQTVPIHTHVWTPPSVPVIHQNSGGTQTNNSWTHGGNHTGMHHHWMHDGATSPPNTSWGQSLAIPTPGTVSASPASSIHTTNVSLPSIHQFSGTTQTTNAGIYSGGHHHHWMNGNTPNNANWGSSLATPTPGTVSAVSSTGTAGPTQVAGHINSIHWFGHHNVNSANWNAATATKTSHTTTSLSGTVVGGIHNIPSINLDLSSTAATTTVGHLLGSGTATINVGGASLVVTGTTLLTPAERVAVQQVLQTGSQSLVIDAQGSASGGSMTVSPFLSQHLSSLVIPQGVSVTDISKSGTLNVKGNIVDDGNLYVVTTNPNVGTVIVNASNITVQSQGLLADLLPAGSVFTSLVPSNLNLTINATNNISNAGSIISAGALNLNAGGTITNAPVNGSNPIIQAASNINLTTGTGNITNNGLIASTHGNINIASTIASNNININAAGGTFQALNGAVNVRDASYTGPGSVGLTGGNYLSQDFNIYSGTGNVNVNVGQLTGALSTYAENAHIFADTPNLLLTNTCVTGDPIFATTGNLQLSGTFSFAEDVAFIAGGNITTAANNTSVMTDGNNIWIIAGADITNISGTATTSPLTAPGSSNITSVSFKFDTNNGGNIDFTQSTASTIFDTLNGGGSQAGNVTLVANSNGGSNGNILFPNAAGKITANTTQYSGGGGAVTIIAGGTGNQGNAIQVGQLETAGATTSGAVTIAAATPSISGGTATFGISGGVITAPTFSYGTSTSGAPISTGAIQTLGYGGGGSGNNGSNGGAGASITITGGGAIQTGNLLSYGGGGGGGVFHGGNGGNAGIISVSSTSGNVQINGEINASGGGGGGSNQGNSSSGGSQANISLTAGGSVTVSGGIFSYAGGSGNGGNGTISPGGGGGSFGGGGGGGPSSTSFGAAGGGNGAAGGGGGTNFSGAGGSGGGFDGGGAGGSPNGQNGSAAANLTYGTGTTGTGGTGASGTGGAGVGGTVSGSGNTLIAGGGGGGGISGGAGGPAGSGQTVGGTLTVTYGTTYSLQGQNVGNTVTNQSGGGGGGSTPTTSLPTSVTSLFTTLTEAQLQNLIASLQANATNAQNQQNEQVGTKIPTDSTPYTTQTGVTPSDTSTSATPTPGTTPANATTVVSSSTPPNYTPVDGTAAGNGGIWMNGVIVYPSGSTTTTTSSTVSTNTASIPSTTSTTTTNNPNLLFFESKLHDLQSAITGAMDAPPRFVQTQNAFLAATISMIDGSSADQTAEIPFQAQWANVANQIAAQTFAVTPQQQTQLNNLIANTITALGGTPPANLTSSVSSTSAQPCSTSTTTSSTATTDTTSSTTGTSTKTAGAGASSSPSPGAVVTQPSLVKVNTTSIMGLVSAVTAEAADSMGTNTSTSKSTSTTSTPSKTSTTTTTTTVAPTSTATTTTNFASALLSNQNSNLTGDAAKILTQLGAANITDAQRTEAVSALASFGGGVPSSSTVVAGATKSSNPVSNVIGPINSSTLAVGTVKAQDPVIATREGVASIPPGAVAIVATRPNETYVYDMHSDLRTGPVTFKVNGQLLKLSTGTGIIITRDLKADFHSLNPYEKLGYRNVRSTDLGGGMKAFICEFSVADGLNNIAAVRDLTRSSDPEERKLAWKMIKDATILADMTGSNYHAGQ